MYVSPDNLDSDYERNTQMRSTKTYLNVLLPLRKQFTADQLAVVVRVCQAIVAADQTAGWNLTVKGLGDRLANMDAVLAQAREIAAQVAAESAPAKPTGKG